MSLILPGFTYSTYIVKAKFIKGHVTLTMPIRGWSDIPRLALGIFYLRGAGAIYSGGARK